jgi:predicted RNA-binding Zn ribbon-like protein
LEERPVGTLNLIGGRLCLDFINTVGARRWSPQGEMRIRDEKLHDYVDLVAWARHAGALQDAQANALARESYRQYGGALAVFQRAIRLREALYLIFRTILSRKPPARSDLAVLNEELRVARSVEQLAIGGSVLDWQWTLPLSTPESVLWPVARSAAELLTSGDLSRLRQCGGDDCGWIFEDTTRNRSRHWCDMRDCGNRARVRRFRRRQKDLHPGGARQSR